MAPHGPVGAPAGTSDDVPLEADWPDLDAAAHRFRADYGMLREVAARLLDDLEGYRRGRGSPASLTGAVPPDPAWGAWEPAAPVRDAAAQAMRHVLEVYQRLLEDCEAAGHLLLQTVQNYAEADAATRAVAGAGGDPAGGW
jgi:hypothetical protein